MFLRVFTFPLTRWAPIQPWICAPGIRYCWVDQGSVEYEVCPTLLHMASTRNRTPDLLILSPTTYPLGHMLHTFTLVFCQQMHSKGLKLGIYEDVGRHTCQCEMYNVLQQCVFTYFLPTDAFKRPKVGDICGCYISLLYISTLSP